MTRVLRGLTAMRRPPARAVVTIGVFDGVHRAHQHLIRTTVALARRVRGTSVILTFDPDPDAVLHPTHAAPALMPLDVRLQEIRALGVDVVWILPFTRAFARMTATQFVRGLLVRRLRTTVLVLGAGFMFGRGRRGTMTLLKSLGPRAGMRVVAMPPIARRGAIVSSSRIRHLITRGRLAHARALLGRRPSLYGVVVRGAGRGRGLGVPTANLQLTSRVLPPHGVYAVTVDRRRRRAWRGVMNLGVRPTFGQGPLVCEVYLLDFSGTLLGEPVAVVLHRRLRGERCFRSPQALVRQIRRDIRRARTLLPRTA